MIVPALIAAAAPVGPPQEHLNKPKLAGFVVVSEEDSGGRTIRKMVPKGETGEVWSRMVADVQLAEPPKSDLARAEQLSDIVDQHTRNATKGCPDPQVGPIYSYPLLGDEIAKFRIICEKPNGIDKPAVTYNIFILSQRYLHQRVVAFSHMPSAQESRWAGSIIDSTRLCAPSSKAVGC